MRIDDELASHQGFDAWFARQWDPALTVAQWWQRLADNRLSAPTLPAPWGRGWDRPTAMAFITSLLERGAIGPPYGMGHFLVTPTLLAHARPELIAHFVPNILNGQHSWCQLFSEPGAGSDLAGLQTRAERDGDEWVIHGQKVWTSGGHFGDYAMLIARTDPNVPKHAGITYFLIDMRQPGIDCRPLRECTGDAMFNEVFIDGARVPAAWVVGEVGDGWRVANTTLFNERSGIGGGFLAHSPIIAGSVAGFLDLSAGECATMKHEGERGNVDFAFLLSAARANGSVLRAVVRQKLASLYTYEKIAAWHLERIKAGSANTGVDGNLAKIRNSAQTVLAREIGSAVLGPDAQLWGDESPSASLVSRQIVMSTAPSIYGGADQIQRNIIGERGLGLPKEPDPTRGLAFNQMAQNKVRD